jgi:hypothetical protein
VACKKIIDCNDVSKLRGLGMCQYRVRCRWEKEEVSNHGEKMEYYGGVGGASATRIDLVQISTIMFTV